MKTKKLTFPIILLLICLLVACNYQKKNGKSSDTAKKELSVVAAIDTCFTKLAEVPIFIDTNREFSYYDFTDKNAHFYALVNTKDIIEHKNEPTKKTWNNDDWDSLSSQKTKGGFKKISIYRLNHPLNGDQLNQFVKNKKGSFLTLRDMSVLYEQAYDKLPLYVWILGGDYTAKDIPFLHLLDSKVFLFQAFPSDKDYKWKKGIAIAYYTTE